MYFILMGSLGRVKIIIQTVKSTQCSGFMKCRFIGEELFRMLSVLSWVLFMVLSWVLFVLFATSSLSGSMHARVANPCTYPIGLFVYFLKFSIT